MVANHQAIFAAHLYLYVPPYITKTPLRIGIHFSNLYATCSLLCASLCSILLIPYPLLLDGMDTFDEAYLWFSPFAARKAAIRSARLPGRPFV